MGGDHVADDDPAAANTDVSQRFKGRAMKFVASLCIPRFTSVIA